MIYNKCLRCGRKLKTDESKQVGFGTICWKKYNEDDKMIPLFSTELSNNNSPNGKESEKDAK